MGGLFEQMRKAQQPVYGQAQQAQFLSGLNDLATSSMNTLKSQLARQGALDSGRLSSGLTDIQLGRMGKASEFFSQLPFMERQAQFQQMLPLLQTGAQWTGRDPLSYINSGSNSQTENSTTTSTGSREQTLYGPDWYRGAFGNLGDLAGLIFGQSMRNGG